MSVLLLKRATYATSIASISTAIIYHQLSPKTSTPETAGGMILPTYQATFSVPLSCGSCVSDISTALSALPGVHSTSFSIPSQIVTTTGTAAPSSIITAIQSTGRPAIVRGSGAPNSAAVTILEQSPSPNLNANSSSSPSSSSPIHGLIRLIQLSPTRSLIDVSLSQLPPGTYAATLRQSGDISRGAASMGGLFQGERGVLVERVVVDREGVGKAVGEVGWGVAEMIGRGIVVRKVKGRGEEEEDRDGRMEGRRKKTDEAEGENQDAAVIGVVARSAGVWENSKVVCACSGKTVWEEREEMVSKGIF